MGNTRASVTASHISHMVTAASTHPKFSANAAQQRVRCSSFFLSKTISPLVVIHIVIFLIVFCRNKFKYEVIVVVMICYVVVLRITGSACYISRGRWFTRRTPSSRRTWTSCPATPTRSSTGHPNLKYPRLISIEYCDWVRSSNLILSSSVEKTTLIAQQLAVRTCGSLK